MKKLSRRFYERNTLVIAKELLGKYLVHITREGKTVGRIVETEAYCGITDKASHAYGGKITERNRIMFGAGGYAYIYLIYGMYYCFNIVTEKEGVPGSVFVRALEPVTGIKLMIRRRGIDPFGRLRVTRGKTEIKDKIKKSLMNGPGKLCIAMGINKELYGENLCDNKLFITEGEKVSSKNVIALPRIGIDYAGEAKHYLWRFVQSE